MECIILAGGLGTRLRSVVNDVPKCMASIGIQPFLFYILKTLERNGFSHVILSLGYKHEIILSWISEVNWHFKISYVIEKEPLGTGGAIKLALAKSERNQVFILNGDTYFDVDYKELYSRHINNNFEMSICLKPMKDFNRYGNVEIDKNSEIVRFNEKAQCGEGLINGGIYLISDPRRLMLYDKCKFSFEKDILEDSHVYDRIFGYITDNYFIDIGIPEDYERAQVDFKQIFHDF